MIQIRPYQEQALDGIRQALNDKFSTLLVMATGLGKTIVFSLVAKEWMRLGRILVLSHREELIFQGHKHLRNITENEPDIEMADFRATTGRNKAQIVVSSIQSQNAGRNGYKRMMKFSPNEFSLIVVDEAHHAPAASYKAVIEYYRQNPDLRVLGVTATPDRADEQALGQIFESVAFEYGIVEGINDGWLVPINQRVVYLHGLDLADVRTTAGDLNGKDLAAQVEKEEVLLQMADATIRETASKKTLIFTASLEHAELLTAILNDNKPNSAKWVHGGTKKAQRANMFREYAEGGFQYLVNVGVATEGYDEPSIEVIVQGKPTLSRSRYAQEIGRGTRCLKGTIDGIDLAEARKSAITLSAKPNLEVLDFVGNSGRHRLITTADILGGDYNDDVVDRAKTKIEQEDKPSDVLEKLSEAKEELEAEAVADEASLRRNRILARAKYSTATVNPFNVLDLEPCREKGWNHGRSPTDKQIAYLQKVGVDTKGLSFTHASQLIDRMFKNRNNKLCTYKQAKVLAKHRFDAKNITFKRAGELIDAIAQNGWRRPEGLIA